MRLWVCWFVDGLRCLQAGHEAVNLRPLWMQILVYSSGPARPSPFHPSPVLVRSVAVPSQPYKSWPVRVLVGAPTWPSLSQTRLALSPDLSQAWSRPILGDFEFRTVSDQESTRARVHHALRPHLRPGLGDPRLGVGVPNSGIGDPESLT